MDRQSLALSFSDSLTEEVSSCVGEFVEIGVDSVLEDGLMKDIPFISTAVSIYRIGKSIRERHHVAKLAVFLNEINKGIADENERYEYRVKFQSDEKFHNQELEYAMILIDRYIGFDKPQMLAKLFLAYLRGEIVWIELTMYAEVIDRFLPGDYNVLASDTEKFITYHNGGSEALLRLMAMGLVAEKGGSPLFTDDGRGGWSVTAASMNRAKMQMKEYRRTEFGDQLTRILKGTQ